MTVNPTIRSVFGYFQNLNLLVLLEDLRSGRTAQGAWASGSWLCPVAHGLPRGRLVGDLRVLSEAAALERACDYAARHLGADPGLVHRFVRLWDDRAFGQTWLLHQLESMWEERLADAEAVQELLEPGEERSALPAAAVTARIYSTEAARVPLARGTPGERAG